MEKISGNELIETILIIGGGWFLVFLYFQNRLVYYIRPDYFLFTLVMGLIMFLAGIVNLISLIPQIFSKKINRAVSLNELFKYLAVLAVVTFGILAPSKVLSAQTAYRRGPNQTAIGGKNVLQQTGNPLLGTSDSSTYNIADWNRLFAVDPEPDDYVGKKVSVDGFVVPQDKNTFQVSRFVITCCAVDATPASLNVNSSGYSVSKDEWVRVRGTFTVQNFSGKRQLVIQPSNITPISQPTDPYFY